MEVKEAYRKKKWVPKPDQFIQCKPELNSNTTIFKEGCQLYGTMEVNRVILHFFVAFIFFKIVTR